MKNHIAYIVRRVFHYFEVMTKVFLLLFLLLPNLVLAQTIVAPNLMIIFGNGYSMNRFLDDKTYDTLQHDHFNDDATVWWAGVAYPNWGSYWLNKRYGEHPSSKMYISKTALSSVLNNSQSANVNLGFATFRQTFGMEVATATLYSNSAWASLSPNQASILTKTTAEKQAYGYDPANFGFAYWGSASILPSGRSSELGTKGTDYNKGVIDDSTATYTAGGLINTFSHKSTATDQTTTASAYGSASVWNNTFATGNTNPPSASNPLAKWTLCSTYYESSSNNTFTGLYLADKVMRNRYDATYDIQYMAWGNKYDASGNSNVSYTTTCPAQGNAPYPYTQNWKRVANTYRYVAGNPRIYFSGIAAYDSPLSGSGMKGVFSGWSGENTYTESTGTMVANYPSGPARIYRDNSDGTKNDRKWMIDGGYQQTTANHMGVFLDLPDPSLGYKDQRATIKGFLSTNQMSDSGLEYDPATQVIANGNGIAASTYSWSNSQSPIYDSLLGALAYYKAYKAKDGFDSCRSNNVLIFFDGKEDAHWTLVNGQRIFVQPAVIAAQLLDIGVKTYVVILSSSPGDIQDANAIALAGGTNQAYAVNDATSLLSAFQTVFSGLSGEVVTASPALPKTLSDTGSYAYVASQESSPLIGHMSAYQVNSKGVVSSTATWDAGALMTTTKRQNALLSNKADGTILAFNSLDDAAFSASGSPDVATIKAFTLDPSYSSGTYLAGRKSGSFLGAFSDQSIAPFMLLPTAYSSAYLIDANYTTFLQTNKNRTKQVLFQNDDGFLYSVNASSGELVWGWLPRTLAASLKNYSTFWNSGAMRGGSLIVDAPVGSSYASYVLGTAKSGEIHYALRLDSTGAPAKVSWVNQVSGVSSPASQAPVATYLTYASSPPYKTYANYLGVSGTTTTLYTQEVGDSTTVTSGVLGLSQPATSELAVNQGAGVAKLYLGDKGGGVWLLDASTSAATAVSGLTKVGTHYGSQTVRYVGAYTSNGNDYVWSASDKGITVYVKDATTSTWKNVWESHVGGAGKWDTACSCATYSADTTGTTASATGIQNIPSGYTISASPIVEKGALIVPVTQGSSSGSLSCSSGEGYYYFFRLTDGFFPKGIFSFVQNNGTTTPLVDNLYIGKGKPKKPTPAFGAGGKFIFGISEQAGSSGSRMPAVKVEGGSSGLISWRGVISR